jgi:hypothetical protein
LQSGQRGGRAILESLTASDDVDIAGDQSLIDVHEAVDRLALGISGRTVGRNSIKARAWLREVTSRSRSLDRTGILRRYRRVCAN